MNSKQIIAEVTTALQQYEESGLIDKISLNQWIRNALREFGGNIMDALEDNLEVQNGYAQLPDNFYALSLAVLCEPIAYSCDQESKSLLQSSFFYQERLEKLEFWPNDLDPPCREGDDCKRIREDLFFDISSSKIKGRLYYGNVRELRLKKGVKRNKNIDVNCMNLSCYNSPYEISIQGNRLQCNFNEGNIYIRYRGLPTNEDGSLEIPLLQRNKLQEYIQYTCIRRTLERLLLNSDDPNVGNKYQLFKSLEDQSYAEAKKDMINEGLLGWADKIRTNNRRYNNRFEVMYSNI